MKIINPGKYDYYHVECPHCDATLDVCKEKDAKKTTQGTLHVFTFNCAFCGQYFFVSNLPWQKEHFVGKTYFDVGDHHSKYGLYPEMRWVDRR